MEHLSTYYENGSHNLNLSLYITRIVHTDTQRKNTEPEGFLNHFSPKSIVTTNVYRCRVYKKNK